LIDEVGWRGSFVNLQLGDPAIVLDLIFVSGRQSSTKRYRMDAWDGILATIASARWTWG